MVSLKIITIQIKTNKNLDVKVYCAKYMIYVRGLLIDKPPKECFVLVTTKCGQYVR